MWLDSSLTERYIIFSSFAVVIMHGVFIHGENWWNVERILGLRYAKQMNNLGYAVDVNLDYIPNTPLKVLCIIF
jgi:hypothetical protein